MPPARMPAVTTLRATCTDLARAELRRRAAEAEAGRRSLADFARFAIAAGVVDGIKRVEWGPHLERYCASLQFQLEGWIVANGPDPGTAEHAEWSAGHSEMIERQRAAWEREYPVPTADGEEPRFERPTWEDGAPKPWLRYVLVQNEIDNLPPGTLKSTLAMVIANAWIWLWDPAFAFGAASGIDANVDRDSKATRDLVRSRWYRETFAIAWYDEDLEDASTIAVKRDSDAVSDWATSAGGKRRSRTISSGFTGTHVDCTFIDDPDDADKVWSDAERIKPQNRFTRAIENRVNCEKRSIRRVLQQRVHPEDFTAYLLSFGQWSPRTPKGWAWLCIPAEYGMQPEDAPRALPFGPVDWRTERGELMHARISAGVLADKRAKLPGYEGQYNQNPRVVGDGMFAPRHARFFVFDGEHVTTLRRRPEGCEVDRLKQPPVVIRLGDLDRITLSVDAANSLSPKPGSKASAVGLIVGACRGEERYCLDDRTRVLGVSGTYRAVFEALREWPIETVLVELKALGAGVVSELELAIRRGWYLDPETDERIELLGPDGARVRCKVVTVSPGKGEDKVQRAHGALPDWERGLSFLHDGAPWLYPHVDENRKTVDEGFIGEICSFPASRRKDRVDAWSQFVAHYRGTSDTRAKWRAMSRLGRLAAGRM